MPDHYIDLPQSMVGVLGLSNEIEINLTTDLVDLHCIRRDVWKGKLEDYLVDGISVKDPKDSCCILSH